MDADMNDDSQYAPKKGEMGTVVMVDDYGTLHMAWDSGCGLGLISGEDCFHIVEE